MNLDLNALVAIDVHTHAETDGCGHYSLPEDVRAAADKYFGTESGPPDVHQLAAYYRQRNMAAVVFTVDARTQLKHEPNSIEDLIAGAARNNDVLIPFGSVDPWHERRAVHRVHELVRDYGVKGFKFHPSMQAFEPNDRQIGRAHV